MLVEDVSLALWTVREELMAPLMLYLSWSERTYTLDTEACDRQADCPRLQEQATGQQKPID